MPGRVAFGLALGIVLGGAAGAVAGARVASWTGGLVGGYGGLLCGMCILGGLFGVLSRDARKQDRGEAFLALVFGVFAAVGAVAGYRVGTLGIPRFSPLAGFFVGMLLLGIVAGVIAAKLLADRAEPAILLVLLFAPIGAGIGAWIGTALGPPGWVAAGLVVGNVLGAALAHLINTGIEEAVYGPDDPVARHHGDYRRW